MMSCVAAVVSFSTGHITDQAGTLRHPCHLRRRDTQKCPRTGGGMRANRGACCFPISIGNRRLGTNRHSTRVLSAQIEAGWADALGHLNMACDYNHV